jgi:4-amino-4-deoxy-L-arabinose transferase-like glycosyltransferase
MDYTLRFIPYTLKHGLFLVLIAFTGLGLLYDFNVPLFEKPDEFKHFAVIQHIQAAGQLPVVKTGENKPWDQEGTQPPLYHILAALTVSWLDLSHFSEPPRNPHYADERSFIWQQRGNNNLYLHPADEAWRIEPTLIAARLARWLSLLAGIGTVSLTYLLARIIFDDSHPETSSILALLSASLVAFIPQFLHTSSAITNDSLSVTLAAAALVMLALIIKRGSSTHYAIYLGVILGLAVLTKLSLLYLLPVTGLVLLLDLYRHRSLRRSLMEIALISALMLLLSGWWYWRNWRVYGDVTALNAHLLYRGGPLNPPPSLAQIWQTELTGLELSFWAAFGAGQILWDPWLYTVLHWLKYLIGLGLVIGLWRAARNGPTLFAQKSPPNSSSPSHSADPKSLLILGILALWSFIIFAALLHWMQITPASWGRLLYPALPALGILTAWSLWQFTSFGPFRSESSKLVAGIPPTAPYIFRFTLLALPLLVAIALFCLALISPFRYLQAAYAKMPLISESNLPSAGLEGLDLTYDGGLRLIAYRVDKSPVHPGDWLPVTLYWQAVRPIAKNYSVFIHLLGQNNAVIGQVNTYPAGGNWPTSFLEPGKILEDTYYIPISPEAGAPAVVRLAMGLFEFEDPARAAKPAVNPAGETVQPVVGAIPLLPRHWSKPEPERRLTANFGGQIHLLGYDGPAAETVIKPGDPIPLTFYWETLSAPGQDLTLFIHLIEPNSQTQMAGFDGPPTFSTAFWQPGYQIADSRQLAVPADLPPGTYELQLGWYNPTSLARLPLTEAKNHQDYLPLLTLHVTP